MIMGDWRSVGIQVAGVLSMVLALSLHHLRSSAGQNLDHLDPEGIDLLELLLGNGPNDLLGCWLHHGRVI